MPHFQAYDLLKWLHIVALSLGGGAAMVTLVLVGLEEERQDLAGLTSVLWKRTAAWAFRLALLLGLALLFWQLREGRHPFEARYLHWKLALVFLLLAFSEMTPKALAKARRSVPLLAVFFFLVATFVSVNRNAFGYRAPARVPGAPIHGAVMPGE